MIGTTFGVGDGSTTFNVPDLRGRTVVALDNLGGSSANRLTGAWADSLGGTGGHEKMQAHVHTIWSILRAEPGAGSGYYSVRASSQANDTSTQSTGDGNAQNIQPSMALSYIIKT